MNASRISSPLAESAEFITMCSQCEGSFYHNMRVTTLHPSHEKISSELCFGPTAFGCDPEVRVEISVGVPNEIQLRKYSVSSRYAVMELTQSRIRGNRPKSAVIRHYDEVNGKKRRGVYDKLYAKMRRDNDDLTLGAVRPVFPRDDDWKERVSKFSSKLESEATSMDVDGKNEGKGVETPSLRTKVTSPQLYNVRPDDSYEDATQKYATYDARLESRITDPGSYEGPLLYNFSISGVRGKAFLDTGVLNLPFNMNGRTSSAFVSETVAEKLGSNRWIELPEKATKYLPASFDITVANDEEMRCKYMIKDVTFRMGKHKETMDLFVIPSTQFDVILGRQWFKLRRPQIDHDDDSLHFPAKTKGGKKNRVVIVPLSGTVRMKSRSDSSVADTADHNHHATFASFWREYKHSREYHLDRTPVHMLRITKKVLGDVANLVDDSGDDVTEFDPPESRFLGNMDFEPSTGKSPDTKSNTFPNFTGKPVSQTDRSLLSNERWEYKGSILNESHPLVERPPSTKLDELMWDEFGDKGKNRFPQEIPNYPDAGTNIDPIIKLMPGHEHDYPCKTPRKLDKLQQKELLTQISYYLEKGWIQPSSSPYGACILFVPKKNGKFRMCFDYRQLNKITVKDKYPLPDAEQVIEQLEGAKYFSQLDLAHGYHQCILAPQDIEKTAFRTTFGSYEWKVMTFGFCNAVPAFVRLMNTTLHKHLGKCCMVFIDDVVIYSKTKEQHEIDCRSVMNALCDANLYVNWTKSQFDVDKIQYLGLNISKEGCTPFDDKVAVVRDWKRPESLYHLRSFLGAVGYYRKFIFNFAKIAKPLTDLTKDNPEREKTQVTNVTMTKWGRNVNTQRFGDNEWTDACQVAFDTLKIALCSHPVLQLPDPTRQYEIMTDASKNASGAVLMQRDENGKLHPIAFYSSKHTDAESNYPVHEFELLAIFKALKQWRHLLIGSEKTLIYTDHKPLTHILSQDKLSPRQERWITYLADYDVDILAVEGTANKVSDCLSRYNYDNLTDLADGLKRSFQGKIASMFEFGEFQSYAHMFALSGFERVSQLQPSVCTFRSSVADDASVLASIFGGGNRNAVRQGSRLSTMTVDTMRGSLIAAYDDDPLAQRVLNGIDTFVDLKLSNGIIMHTDRDGRKTVYIPRNAMIASSQLQTEHPVEGDVLRPECSLREEILRDLHGDSHIGTGKLIDLIRRTYYWPKLRRSVADYVRGCTQCQQNKQRTHKLYGKLRSLGLPTRRWAEINIDFIVSLPTTRRGHDAILVVIDRYSKRAHFIPTKTTASASTTAQLFYENVWKLHGLPLKIISDRDSKFTSDFWRSLMKLLNTSLAMSTPYHPQTDGLVERTNLTLKEMLRAFSDNGGRDWDLYLPAAEFEYNRTYNTSIKETPFKLDTGQHPLDTHEVAVQKLVQEAAEDDAFDYDGMAEEFLEAWNDSLLVAKQCISEAIDTMKMRYDKLKQDIVDGSFKVGSKVYLDGKHLKVVDTQGNLKSRKALDQRRLGPYEIVEVLAGGTAFRLKLPEYQKFHDVQPISRLELIKESVEFPDAHVEHPFLPIIRDEVEEYEIEKIVRHKTVRGKRQFLVKYLGYDSSFNEWKHREELANAQDLLETYELERGLVRTPARRSARVAEKDSPASLFGGCVCNGPLMLGCTCGYYGDSS